MDELPDSLKDEIDAIESLDARALRRRYATLVGDLPNCALCGILRTTVAYRLQERHYGLSQSQEATTWLDEPVDDKRAFPGGRKVGLGARRPSGMTGTTSTEAKSTRRSPPSPRPSPGRCFG